MAADIFVQIAQLFRKEPITEDVNVFVLHRFLASEVAYAPVAKELSRIYNDRMVVEIWKASLPRMAKAPYLKYAGPKRPPASSALVKKIADAEGYTLMEADEVVQVLTQLGQGDSLWKYYGVEETTA